MRRATPSRPSWSATAVRPSVLTSGALDLLGSQASEGSIRAPVGSSRLRRVGSGESQSLQNLTFQAARRSAWNLTPKRARFRMEVLKKVHGWE
jgi:hypothetical protein